MTYRNKILGALAAAAVVVGVAGVPAQADASSATTSSARSTHPAKHGVRHGKEVRKAALSAQERIRKGSAERVRKGSAERKAAAAGSAG